jgi:hypothetical protein
VTVDGAVAEASPVARAAAATAISSTPSSRSDRFARVEASGKKCTPTPAQIHTGMGGAACPQPNHTKAKNPSTTTVTPRSRPAGKKLVRWSVTVALRLLTPRHVLECPGIAIGVGERGLGPVDVADGHQYELEQEIAGTYRKHRVSRAIGFGHGITITTRGSRARGGPEPRGLVVRLLT